MKNNFFDNFKFLLAISVIYSLIAHSCSTNNNSAMVMLLDTEWKIQSSKKISQPGEALSSANAEITGWYNAKVPSTVMGSLVNDNVYPDVFFGKNLASVEKDQFQSTWWYRKVFNTDSDKSLTYKLEFDGIIYRANIWLNGTQIANADTIEGPFRQYSFDITSIIKNGENVLAVEVFAPAQGDLTVGFVDWNPESPDRAMGLWREVRLRVSGDVSVKYPFVKTKLDTETLKSADLTVSCEVQNNSDAEVSGTLKVTIDGGIELKQKVTLNPRGQQLVEFTPENFPALAIQNPRVWWTHNMGTPELYGLRVEFVKNNTISDFAETHFGIRDIEKYTYTKYGRIHNGFKLNGKKLVVNGGGWVDQLFLMPDSVNLIRQIEYVKHMNLNAIRPEGFWGNNHHLYDLCDREGVLIMTGWSCQWEWPQYCGKAKCHWLYGCIETEEEIELVAQSWKDMVKWLRNHPSIFLWMTGSDMLPLPELEKKYIAIMEKEDPTRPMVTSAYMRESTISGWSGMKMEGPYEYVPPVYWYIDTVYGGAYGFNTETGPGAQVPPIESIKKMIPENELWPINDTWEYHCGRNEFQTLSRYNAAMDARFGKPGSLEEYCIKAQLLNYESIRPMFEAFQVNRYESTGIIQWMLNSSWPKLIWQLYGYDLLPNGALYGTKKALEPLQAIYDYGKHEIVVTNSSVNPVQKATVQIKVLNLDMKELVNETIEVSLDADEKKTIFTISENLEGLESTYFLDLRIFDEQNSNKAINQYLLTKTKHEFDWKKTYFAHTPTLKHQNLQEINNLPKVKIESEIITEKQGDKTLVTVEAANTTASLALSVELMLVGNNSREAVAPVFLDDNYFSLLPGEKRIIKGYFYTSDLKGEEPALIVRGINVTE